MEINFLQLSSSKVSERHDFYHSAVMCYVNSFARSRGGCDAKDPPCRVPCPVIPGTNYSKERQNSGNRAACEPCPFYADSIGMLSLHIGPAVSEKNGP